MRWLSKDVVIAIHAEAIARFGGSDGLRDEGLLESALARPRQLHAYGTGTKIHDLAAAYCIGLVKNHAFVDGNKRIGFLTADTFLRLNGYKIVAPQVDIVLTIERLAANRLTEADLRSWLQKNSAPLS